MKKIVEQNERYDIIQMNFRDLPITFRYWKDGSGIIEARVDENFAKANWIRVNPNGDFTFVGINRALLN